LAQETTPYRSNYEGTGHIGDT